MTEVISQGRRLRRVSKILPFSVHQDEYGRTVTTNRNRNQGAQLAGRRRLSICSIRSVASTTLASRSCRVTNRRSCQ